MKYLLLLTLVILSCAEDDLSVSKTAFTGEIIEETLIGCQFEITAQFPGGSEKLTKFVASTLEWSSKECIQGRVFVSFIVDQHGSITDPVVLKGIDSCESCEDAALQVVRKMPSWIPANIRGVPVRQKLIMPIKFGID